MPNDPEPFVAHDSTMIDWMLSLSPDERLAELESRVAFFGSVQSEHESELPRDSSRPE